jgi:hypothetical protein
MSRFRRVRGETDVVDVWTPFVARSVWYSEFEDESSTQLGVDEARRLGSSVDTMGLSSESGEKME